MKTFIITLACIIAYVTASCDNVPSPAQLAQFKCQEDIAFSGSLMSGQTSAFGDGELYSLRVDTLNVLQAFKGDVSGDLTVTAIIPQEGDCAMYPYGGHNALVFASLNTTYNVYQLKTCFQSPALECVDLVAFENVAC